MMRGLHKIFMGMVFGCSTMSAAAEEAMPQVVKINDFKSPQMHSYRAVVAGLDMFDKLHRLAPAAPGLRFHYRMREDQAEASPAPVLRIAGDEFLQYIAIGADGRFSVPRVQQAIDEDAVLIMNRKKRTYSIRPEVRTPGLPDHVRRLGDVRLECQVLIAIAKKEAPLWVVLAANSLFLTTDWCGKLTGGEGPSFSGISETTIAAATLVQGERKLVLKTDKREFSVPIGDTSWTDDALVELSFADAQPK